MFKKGYLFHENASVFEGILKRLNIFIQISPLDHHFPFVDLNYLTNLNNQITGSTCTTPVIVKRILGSKPVRIVN